MLKNRRQALVAAGAVSTVLVAREILRRVGRRLVEARSEREQEGEEAEVMEEGALTGRSCGPNLAQGRRYGKGRDFGSGRPPTPTRGGFQPHSGRVVVALRPPPALSSRPQIGRP